MLGIGYDSGTSAGALSQEARPYLTRAVLPLIGHAHGLRQVTTRRKTPRAPDVEPLLPLARPTGAFLTEGALDMEAQRAVRAFSSEAESDNTRRAYAQAYRYWGAWFALRYGKPLRLPVAVPVIEQFIVDHLVHKDPGGRSRHLLPRDADRILVERGYKEKEGPLSLATVEGRLAALSSAHRTHATDADRTPNPVRAESVRRLLASVRRAYAKRGASPRKAKAATLPALEKMLATCDDSLIGVRDRALLLFGFASGGRRRSEITAATFESLVEIDGGGWLYRLGFSKTNRSGRDDAAQMKPVVGTAAEALNAWMAKLGEAGVSSGPLFRRLTNDIVGEGLSPAGVRDIVVRRAKLAGLGEGFSAHSLRSGFVTEAGKQQVPLGETMALTGHRNLGTMMGYFQIGAAESSVAARLVDTKKQR